MTRLNKGLLASIVSAGLLAFALGGTASAQDKGAKKKSEPERVKTYDFSGDDIDGDLVKPDGEMLNPRVYAQHTSLIRIRQDFIREIIKSANDL